MGVVHALMGCVEHEQKPGRARSEHREDERRINGRPAHLLFVWQMRHASTLRQVVGVVGRAADI